MRRFSIAFKSRRGRPRLDLDSAACFTGTTMLMRPVSHQTPHSGSPHPQSVSRSSLKGLAMSASAGVLVACGGGGASGGGTAATPPAAGAAVGSGATAAPAVQSTGTATTVVWFAARDTTGYTPKQVDAFN